MQREPLQELEVCRHCHMKVAPAAKDRHCREIGGRKVVAHSVCLKRENLKPAVDLACQMVELHAGDCAPKCRQALLAANGFEATIKALKFALAQTFHHGTGPQGRRQQAVRTTAQTLEDLLLVDFPAIISPLSDRS